MERPDLDAVEQMLETCPEDAMGDFYFKMTALLTYCRALEAENKRLQDELRSRPVGVKEKHGVLQP